MNPQKLEKAKKIIACYGDEWFNKIEGIHGIGIGKMGNDICIKMYVLPNTIKKPEGLIWEVEGIRVAIVNEIKTVKQRIPSSVESVPIIFKKADFSVYS